MILPDPPILIITDRKQCHEPLEARASALFRGGCRWLSLREKDLDAASRLALLQRLTALAAEFGATISVHDDIIAARACGTALHIPAGGDLAGARRMIGAQTLLGQSCHTAAEAHIAAAGGADYVTVSPVFASASKPGYGPALGNDGVAQIAILYALPIIALGGVTLTTLPSLGGTGIKGAAIMGEAMSTPDPESWFQQIRTVVTTLSAASRRG